MAPFDTRNGKKYIMVKPDIIFDHGNAEESILDEIRSTGANRETDWDVSAPVVTEKEEYLKQVESIKDQICRGYFQKSVLSRIKVLSGNYIPQITRIFEAVCESHPNAFVYLFRSGDQFWMGASPEPLLRITNGNVLTVSLAGTRPYSAENMLLSNWTAKEVLEQEYVTRYIHDILREFNIRDYRVTSPYVKKAGDLVHLRSDFALQTDQVRGRIWELLDSMHPTPAVAGQPKDDAISFIKKLEPHDREYYTGFLGPVKSDESIDLFVNLRCFRITPDYISLFVGGGITLESDPEEEWEETQLKAKSLLTIIDQISRTTDDKITLQSAHR